MTMSRITAAHSMTKMWEIEVSAWRGPEPAPDAPRRLDAHVHGGVALHGAGHVPCRPGPGPPRGSRARRKTPEPQRQEDDHHRSADELGQRELPSEEQGEDDAELDDEIGGGDLEHHGGGEARTLAEQRPGQRHRRVRTRRRCRPQARWPAPGHGACRHRGDARSCCAARRPGRPRPGRSRGSGPRGSATSSTPSRAARGRGRAVASSVVLGHGHRQELAQAVLEQRMGERRERASSRRPGPPCGRSPVRRCAACAARRTRRRRSPRAPGRDRRRTAGPPRRGRTAGASEPGSAIRPRRPARRPASSKRDDALPGGLDPAGVDGMVVGKGRLGHHDLRISVLLHG